MYCTNNKASDHVNVILVWALKTQSTNQPVFTVYNVGSKKDSTTTKHTVKSLSLTNLNLLLVHVCRKQLTEALYPT